MSAGNDRLLAAGTPVPVGDADRERLADYLRKGNGDNPIPIRRAYKVPLTLLPSGDGPPLDLGPFERTVVVAGPADAGEFKVTVRGTLTGAVALAEGTEVKIGQFPAKHGKTVTAALVADRPGVELELVPGEFVPKYLQVELGLPSDDGRRRWPLRVTVPPDTSPGDLPRDAAVVARTKGPNQQRIRIPVRGTGSFR